MTDHHQHNPSHAHTGHSHSGSHHHDAPNNQGRAFAFALNTVFVIVEFTYL